MPYDADEFVGSLGFVYPIAFESGDADYPFYCGGTCFAVRFNERLFLITASHCLTNREGDPCIVGPDQQRFPIKQTFSLKSHSDCDDWADITCIAMYGRKHWPSLRPTDAINIDEILHQEITAKPGDFLVLKGYPTSHTVFESSKILRKPSLHLGFYGGPTADKFCHFFDIFHPVIDDPDGLSGSPVILMDHTPERGVFPTILGIVTRGGKGVQHLRFIGVDIIFQSLLNLDRRLNDVGPDLR